MAEQEVLAPGDNVNIDAVMAALGRADDLQRRLHQTNAELVACFDSLGFALHRLGLLEQSAFWQQHGPVPVDATLTAIVS